MSPVDLDRLLERAQPDRREFLRTLILGTAYAAPLVASFSMDGLARPALAQAPNAACRLPDGIAVNTVAPNTATINISKAPAQEPVPQGVPFKFIVTVENLGPEPAYEVLIEDHPQLDFSSPPQPLVRLLSVTQVSGPEFVIAEVLPERATFCISVLEPNRPAVFEIEAIIP